MRNAITALCNHPTQHHLQPAPFLLTPPVNHRPPLVSQLNHPPCIRCARRPRSPPPCTHHQQQNTTKGGTEQGRTAHPPPNAAKRPTLYPNPYTLAPLHLCLRNDMTSLCNHCNLLSPHTPAYTRAPRHPVFASATTPHPTPSARRTPSFPLYSAGKPEPPPTAPTFQPAHPASPPATAPDYAHH